MTDQEELRKDPDVAAILKPHNVEDGNEIYILRSERWRNNFWDIRNAANLDSTKNYKKYL